MDAFSQILSGVVLRGALFFNAEFYSPWGFIAPTGQELARSLAPDAPHLLIYHFLIEGSGLVRLGNDLPIKLEPGDVIVVPHGDAHQMCSAQGVANKPSEAMAAKLQARDLSALQTGGGGEVARFVCGFMVCAPLLCRPILQACHPYSKSTCGPTDRAISWRTHCFIWSRRQRLEMPEVKRCWRKCLKRFSLTRCVGISPACRNKRSAGWPPRAI